VTGAQAESNNDNQIGEHDRDQNGEHGVGPESKALAQFG
jgi:hypothetical protein